MKRFAIGLGCEIQHAGALVYADDLDVTNARAFQPIGISCRICERRDCHQRAVPPLEKAWPLAFAIPLCLTVSCIDEGFQHLLPYRVGD